jgi:integrase
MARKPNVFPSYLLHKQSGQARVRIGGKDYLLGEYGSEKSRIRYGELIAKHAGGIPIDPFAGSNRGSIPQSQPDAGLTINELVLAFMRHADGHYVKNGKPTSEIHCLKSATRPLVDLYGFTPVDSFGPMMLKAVRQKYVEAGWVRDTCNKGVKRIRTIFKWGVENEMVAPATLQGLQAVAPLLAGRTEAKDNPDRLPATDEQIKAVKPHVSQLVKDLIDVQRFTGARAGELLLLTPEKLVTSDKVWLFHVDGHKTEHHGHSRVVAIGANAQAVLKRRMKKLKSTDRIFKIRRDSYTLAVRRACVKAEIKPWTPHQLRHAMGNQVRERFGLEHVQATLGHADFAMSEVYAKASLQKAIEVASAVG